MSVLLTVPDPKIALDSDGFDGVCTLNRQSDGQKLSDLVERISNPMVIALDAPWGAGKSVFLKCWVGKPTDTDIRAVWTLVTENSSDFVASQEIRGQRKRLFGDRSPPLVLQLVIAETLDVFEMST